LVLEVGALLADLLREGALKVINVSPKLGD
jgi:hypothetical protein